MFGAVEGMFLGYTITPEGIKPYPDKTEVVLQLPSTRTIKEVQSLNGKLASLNRFLSKSAEKSLPLFKTLKRCIKKSNFRWTPKAEQAFKQLKQHLSELPLLVAPKQKEELIVYLSASYKAVSAVLMIERGTVQKPVYFISRALQGLELNYTPMEKLVLLLVFSAKRLRRYFQAWPPDSGADGRAECTSKRGLQVGSKLSPGDNKKADALSKIALTSFAHLSKQALVEVLQEKSIHEKEVTTVVEEDGPTWMTPIMEYLKDGTLPGDRKEASKLRIKARQYELMEETLYSMHTGPRSVVAKAMRLGYYWPTMHRDIRDMIRVCNDCQVHRPVPRNPQQPLTPIMALWPFYKRGIDIAGPFSEGPGKVKFLIVAIDYFTKWIEAKVMATITGNQDWCDKLNITQRFASVKHPQSNRLVERANRSLGEGIKARLGEGNKNWLKELPHVLWAHRTMIKSSHGDTPFYLTYGTEAVMPAEIRMPTYRTATINTVHNDEELQLNLDLLEEKRERAAICEAKSKMKMAKYYNARVRGVAFRPGDFVYRSNDVSHTAAGGKLGPKWEGPYEVTEALGDGAYKLRTMDGTDLPRTWNIANLKKCYL
ncbi:reverse transcriptase domain-containing protein [Tanacetum coccineum]